MTEKRDEALERIRAFYDEHSILRRPALGLEVIPRRVGHDPLTGRDLDVKSDSQP